MQTIDQFCQELKLSPEQSQKLKQYVSLLIIDLLETLKEENVKNFDETIEGLTSDQ